MNKLDKVIKGHERNSPLHILEEEFVIGGAEIYKKYFPFANKLYLTEVWGDIEGDTYLEGFNPEEWDITYVSNPMEENGFKFIFKEYTKKLAIG
jgi:dihydrofolate reductase